MEETLDISFDGEELTSAGLPSSSVFVYDEDTNGHSHTHTHTQPDSHTHTQAVSHTRTHPAAGDRPQIHGHTHTGPHSHTRVHQSGIEDGENGLNDSHEDVWERMDAVADAGYAVDAGYSWRVGDAGRARYAGEDDGSELGVLTSPSFATTLPSRARGDTHIRADTDAADEDELDMSLLRPGVRESVADVEEFEALERLVLGKAAPDASERIAAPTVSSILSAHTSTHSRARETSIREAAAEPTVAETSPSHTPTSAPDIPASHPASIQQIGPDAKAAASPDVDTLVVGFRRALRDKSSTALPPQQPFASPVDVLTMHGGDSAPATHVDGAKGSGPGRAPAGGGTDAPMSLGASDISVRSEAARSIGLGPLSRALLMEPATSASESARSTQAALPCSRTARALTPSTSPDTTPTRVRQRSSEGPRHSDRQTYSNEPESTVRRSTAGISWTLGGESESVPPASQSHTQPHGRSPGAHESTARTNGNLTATEHTARRDAPRMRRAVGAHDSGSPEGDHDSHSAVAKGEHTRQAQPLSRIPVSVYSGTPAKALPAHGHAVVGEGSREHNPAALALAELAPHSPGTRVDSGAPLERVDGNVSHAPRYHPMRTEHSSFGTSIMGAPQSSTDGSLLAQVESKVAALNDQIARYQDEVLRLQAAQRELAQRTQQLDEGAAALAKERAEFRTWKSAETAKLESWKAEVTAKMERERRVAVRQARAAATAAVSSVDRQEKAELEELRSQVAKLRADLQAADARYKATVERHRASMAASQERISQLEAQVQAYEQQRIAMRFDHATLDDLAAGSGAPALPGDEPSSGHSSRRSSIANTASKATHTARSGPRGAANTVRSSSLEPRPGSAVAARGRSTRGVAGADTRPTDAANPGQYARRAPATPSSPLADAPAVHVMRHDSAGRVTRASEVTLNISDPARTPPRAARSMPLHTETASGYSPSRYGGSAAPYPSDTLGRSLASNADTQATPAAATSRKIVGRAPPSVPAFADVSTLPDLRASGSTTVASHSAPPTADVSHGSRSNVTAATGEVAANLRAEPRAPEHRPSLAESLDNETVPAASTTSQKKAVPAAASWELRRHISLGLTASNVAVGSVPKGAVPVHERDLGGDKREQTFHNGVKVVIFRNGTNKEVHEDGTTIIRFNNGDVKRTVPLRDSSGTGPGSADVYLYADSGTLQSTYPGDVDIFEFSSGQIELHRKSTGEKEVLFPDGSWERFPSASSNM